MIFELELDILDLVTADLADMASICAGKDNPDPSRYGSDITNSTMRMHPYCWCEHPDCPWCNPLAKSAGVEGGVHARSAPNFWHRESDTKIWWYKTLGRSMQCNKDLTQAAWSKIAQGCKESLLGLG